MTFDEYRKEYWRMYLILEKELVEALDYVELSQNNFQTTSITFSKLLLSIGSEIDNVFRECSGIPGRSNIETYFNSIVTKYPSIVNQQVKVKDTDISLTPYKGWNGIQPSQSLIFWDRYNGLKHDRVINSKNASLENVLNALAGLFIIEIYRFDDIFRTETDTFVNMPDDSQLFILFEWSMKVRHSKVKLEYSLFDEEFGSYDYQVED